MVAHSEMMQRIARLTPLSDVAAMIDSWARPVAAQQIDLQAAFGRVLAEDCRAPAAKPEAPIALRDGWAVSSDDLADAGSYAPVPLAQPPQWLETGDLLPAGYDAVAPVDAIAWRGNLAEAVAPVTAGEGVLPVAGDVAAATLLRTGGGRLRRIDLAALAAVGIERVAVRAPRIALVRAGAASPVLDASIRLIDAAIVVAGGTVVPRDGTAADHLDRAMHDDTVDAMIAIGGTGTGKRDGSVRALARNGTVAMHGLAVSPGETTALGTVDGRPVLLLPGRLDAALAVWLTVGRPMLRRLWGGIDDDAATEATLSRKVSSPLGLTEVVLVRSSGDACEPLASGYLSLGALVRADGWIRIPPDSEGYPAGTSVRIRPLP